MGSQVPLLNNYKQVFFWKRFTQTLLGGLKLRLGYDAPIYVYINQVVLFIVPFVLGGLITVLIELNVLRSHIGVYLYGTCMVIYVLSAQCISLFLQKRSSSAIARLNVQNVLAEEDEVEFVSCIGAETLEFVLPTKKWKLNIVIQALISGVMCGLGLWFLLPSILNVLYSSVAATVILFVFGWLTVCIAQYPLTVTGPPEPATYRTTDTYETMPLLRAFYLMPLLAVDLTWRFYPSELLVVNQCVHFAFVALPVLWILGVLPPLDALWVWMGEQLLYIAFGGSYVASDIRLVLMLLLACTEFVLACLLPSTLAVTVFCACIGYILSLDISTVCNQALHIFLKQTKNEKTPKNGTNMGHSQPISHTDFGWPWGWKECVAHFAMLVLIGGISGVCSYFSGKPDYAISQTLGYFLIALLVIGKILSICQSIYIFGIWKNPLFPCNVQSLDIYHRKKRLLNMIGYVRRFLMFIVAPYMMLAYVSLYNTALPSIRYMYVLGSVRALRRIWQCSTGSLLELSIVHIINATGSNVTWVTSASLGLQLMLVAFCCDRILQFLHKIYTYMVILITSYTVKKQRRSSTMPMIIASACLFPLTLTVLALAAVLSAPLLPLFTLPIMLIGFPRSMRSSPEPVGASASVCDDSIYYEQLAPKLTLALRRAMANGSLGTIEPGLHYLVRFQDRMVWLQVLETGFGYCTLSIKGMELQETSCHTVEASEIDAIFETAFEYEREFKCCSLSQYPLHSLVPMDAFPVHTYSDARNVLTGIIDSPDTLRMIDECFLKTLIWVLLHHNSSRKRVERSSTSSSNKIKTAGLPPDERCNSRTGLVAQGTPLRADTQDSGRPLSLQSTENSDDVRPVSETKSRTTSWASLKSWGDDENDSLDLNFSTKKKGVNLNIVKNKNFSVAKNRIVESPNEVPTLPGTISDSDKEIDDLLNEFDFGLPAMDANLIKKSAIHQNGIPMSTFKKPIIGIKLAGSMQFTSPHSSKLSLPFKWREIPLEPSQINPYLGRFPKDWYLHVLEKLDLAAEGESAKQVAAGIAEDNALTNMYSYLVLACYVVTNVLNRSGQDVLSPNHVYKVYSGEIPWSTSLEWLKEDPELLGLVIKAFRLTFKLAYDQAVLGEANDLEELSDYLQEYETDWYMGSEKDTDWTKAIRQEKQQLFSLTYDSSQRVFQGRVLSKRPVMAYVGQLNAELVRALWASISLELLYFTNDDEERYSIQAHPVILRNLSVQAADPPLGYPIYASPPISVPTF